MPKSMGTHSSNGQMFTQASSPPSTEFFPASAKMDTWHHQSWPWVVIYLWPWVVIYLCFFMQQIISITSVRSSWRPAYRTFCPVLLGVYDMMTRPFTISITPEISRLDHRALTLSIKFYYDCLTEWNPRQPSQSWSDHQSFHSHAETGYSCP